MYLKIKELLRTDLINFRGAIDSNQNICIFFK